MAQIVLVMGETGSGKTASLRNVNPDTSFLINVTGKPLSYPGWAKMFTPYNKETKMGNMVVSHKESEIVGEMGKTGIFDKIIQNKPQVENIFLDDFQYIMSFEFMERAKEKGYEKFTEIGQHAFNIIQKARSLPDNVTVFFLCHSDDIFVEGNKKTKVKTIGRMLDEKVTLEGLFTIVLLSMVAVEDNELKHYFITNSDGTTTAKSPMEMFDFRIENDLQKVIERIKEYNS